MNTWPELKRKHGSDVRAVPAARDEMHRRLGVQGDPARMLGDRRAKSALAHAAELLGKGEN